MEQFASSIRPAVRRVTLRDAHVRGFLLALGAIGASSLALACAAQQNAPLLFGKAPPMSAAASDSSGSSPTVGAATSPSVSATPPQGVNACSTQSACYQLARRYRSGRGVERDSGKALALFERACALGEGPSNIGCGEYAYMLREGEGGVERNEARALEVYKRTCDRGVGSGCLFAARLLTNAVQFAHDEAAAQPLRARALELLSAGCTAHNSGDCNLVGWMHQIGEAPGASPKSAAEAFRQGCDGKNLASCDSYAFHLQNGVGVPRDEQAAFHLYSAACDAQVLFACVGKGFMLASGRGTGMDTAAADAAFRAGCYPSAFNESVSACDRLNDPQACGMAALMAATGVCTEKDLNTAARFKDRACATPYAWYCDRLKALKHN